MKKLVLLLLIPFVMSCGKSEGCGTANGKALIKGPKGGCYYNNSNGNKTYVDRSLCNC